MEDKDKIPTKALPCVLGWEWELAYREHRLFPAAASEPSVRWLDGGSQFEKSLIGQGSLSESRHAKEGQETGRHLLYRQLTKKIRNQIYPGSEKLCTKVCG